MSFQSLIRNTSCNFKLLSPKSVNYTPIRTFSTKTENRFNTIPLYIGKILIGGIVGGIVGGVAGCFIGHCANHLYLHPKTSCFCKNCLERNADCIDKLPMFNAIDDTTKSIFIKFPNYICDNIILSLTNTELCEESKIIKNIQETKAKQNII